MESKVCPSIPSKHGLSSGPKSCLKLNWCIGDPPCAGLDCVGNHRAIKLQPVTVLEMYWSAERAMGRGQEKVGSAHGLTALHRYPAGTQRQETREQEKQRGQGISEEPLPSQSWGSPPGDLGGLCKTDFLPDMHCVSTHKCAGFNWIKWKRVHGVAWQKKLWHERKMYLWLVVCCCFPFFCKSPSLDYKS